MSEGGVAAGSKPVGRVWVVGRGGEVGGGESQMGLKSRQERKDPAYGNLSASVFCIEGQ